MIERSNSLTPPHSESF